MMRILVALLLIASAMSGCVSQTSPFYDFDGGEHYRNPGVFEGVYQLGPGGAYTLERGQLLRTGPTVVRLESGLPAYDGLVPTDDADADIVMAIWLPMNATDKVPVIVDAGPYFEIGGSTITDADQRTPFHIQNFLPHGYAVVQLAVRGTGTAGGCMDLGGPSEQHDLDQAITWLGQQPWSNGSVAMMGASYDGTTPWEVAAMGNPYLKTIVPTSGVTSWYDLMFHNGSAETRGPIMHNQVYWGFGFDDEFPQRPDWWPGEVPWLPSAGIGQATDREDYQDRQNLLCPEVVEGSAVAGYTTVAGDDASTASTYWTERDYRAGVLANYRGSVFIIHGLQDWNVDPHMVVPFNRELRAAGLEVKEWYGQWGHSFPDSTCAADAPEWVVLPCRLDFGEVMLRWFDHYLKGGEKDLGPEIQVQDNIGFWRNADAFPPTDPEMVDLRLSGDGRLVLSGGIDGQVVIAPDPTEPGARATLVSDPLPEDLHLSGLVRLSLPFQTVGEGGNLAAWLFDVDERGYARAIGAAPRESAQNPDSVEWTPFGYPLLGHAQMNLRFYDGGTEARPLVPGQRYVAQMEFEPLEARVPVGHRLQLWVFQYQYMEHMEPLTPAPVILELDADAVLHLPTIDVDPRTVFPVPGAHFLNRTDVPEMYIPIPVLPSCFQAAVSPLPCTGGARA